MNRFRDMKKIINLKVLHTLPLAGIGLICTYQNANAMFNPPKNPPKIQHFNKPITSSSSPTTTKTGRLQTTPTSSHSSLTNTTNSGQLQVNSSTSSKNQPITNSPRPWRHQQTSSNINPNRPTGGKISSLISKFELLSTSGTKQTPTSKTSDSSTKPAHTPKTSDSSTKPAPTPKTSDSNTKPAPTPKTSDSNTKPITAPDYIALGARPKTSTSKSSKPTPSTNSTEKGESTLKITAHNLSDLIKDSSKTALGDELSRELDIILTQNKSSSGETIDETISNLWKLIYETSGDAFQTELKNEISLRGIPFNEKTEQDLIKASEDFGRLIGNTAATHLKRTALGFKDVAVTEDNIPDVIEKIEKVSQSFGDNMSESVFKGFLTSAFDFIVDHS